MGIFSTMPVVSLPLGPVDISVFRILFYGILALLLYQTISKGFASIRKHSGLMIIWLTIGVISCLIGWVFLQGKAPKFSSAAGSFIPKTLAYLVFAVLWGNQDSETLKHTNRMLIRGILWGCIINAVWAITDAAGYYLLHRSINNLVFARYIARNNIRYGELSLIINGQIRSGGFNYDPAHLGFISPLLTCYGLKRKQKRYLFLALGSIVASASTTALVCSVIVAVLNYFMFAPRKNGYINRRNAGIAITAVVLCGIIIGVNWSRVSSLAENAAGKMIDRINNVYLNSGDTDIRWDYLLLAPKAFLNLGVFMLTGTGFGTASYGYVTDTGILYRVGGSYEAFDLENTYICYLMDTGIIGLALFLIILAILIYAYRNRTKAPCSRETDITVFSGVMATSLSMLFYHYILFAPQMLILAGGLSELDLNDPDTDSLISRE